jgi:uncharacterized membrane protein
MVLLGISSGLCWGTADFFGGLQSRRLPALAVAFWSQVAGGLALLLVLAFVGGRPSLAGVLWGMGAGVFGGAALVLFYRGLAQGVMSVVAPVSACGAVIPVLAALGGGEAPGVLAILGIITAIGGIVLVSLQPEETPADADKTRGALGLALGAAVGFGMFFALVDRGAAVGGASPLWTVGGARIGSLGALLGMIVLRPGTAPWPGRRSPAVAAIGLMDTTANALFAYASIRDSLGIAAVLGSLYPVATVLLGRVVLEERLTRTQGAGVLLALAGVALLSAG